MNANPAPGRLPPVAPRRSRFPRPHPVLAVLAIVVVAVVLGLVLAVVLAPPEEAVAPAGSVIQPNPGPVGGGAPVPNSGSAGQADATRQARANASATASDSQMASNQSGALNGIAVTVRGVRRESAGATPPAAGSEYLIVTASFENTSVADKSFSPTANVYLLDPANKKYSPVQSPAPTVAPGGKLRAGGVLRGDWTFEVPKGATGLLFTYDPGTGSTPLTIKLSQ